MLFEIPSESHQKLSSGADSLDKVLGGGIACGSITELCGEPAAAKSQLCLQLLLSAQRPVCEGGLDGSCLYFYTEGEPPLKRLREMASFQHTRSGPDTAFQHIFVERDVTNGYELLQRLERAEGLLLEQPQQKHVRLIVIDSVANIMRDPGGSGRAMLHERANMMFQTAGLLKRLANKYHLAVVVVNQVSDAISDKPQENGCGHTAGLQLRTSGREVIPALGLAWANCVNTRLFLSRLGHVPWPMFLSHARPQAASALQHAAEAEHQGLVLRSLQVVFSPHLPQAGALYVVLQSGVVGVPHPSTWANCKSVTHAQTVLEISADAGTSGLGQAVEHCPANVLQSRQPVAAGDEQEGCLNRLLNIECTKGSCPAGEACQNQSIQKRRSPPTRLTKVGDRGWGLFAAGDIKAGSFVIEYTGEVILFEEAERRAHVYEAVGLQHTYIMSLSSDLQIDATMMGSTARFINHSCAPNCETQKWLVGGALSVCIFALQDISPGTELTYNYNLEWNGGHRIRCLCGAPTCIGFIGRACQDSSMDVPSRISEDMAMQPQGDIDQFDSDEEDCSSEALRQPAPIEGQLGMSAMFLVKRKRRKMTQAISNTRQAITENEQAADSPACSSDNYAPEDAFDSENEASFPKVPACSSDQRPMALVSHGSAPRIAKGYTASCKDVAAAAKRRKRKPPPLLLPAASTIPHTSDICQLKDVSETQEDLSSQRVQQPEDCLSNDATSSSLLHVQMEWLHGRLDAQVISFERAYWRLTTGYFAQRIQH
ncbi:hypothetical protein WJX74_009147 [Apatococcus lobatus]|uniref:Uncharacterized protein n=1 Tax=Apatococcus lobatus TaxID=904363 RepID=A0AAW1S7M8_9CHLO